MKLPSDYHSKLSVLETEYAIKKLKDFFEQELAIMLDLIRVSAPLFVLAETGLNDNLNGTEEPVHFKIFGKRAEIVHSLAKWKRYALAKYDFPIGSGLYTDMNAIRKDEQLDAIHSYYVDQWDWEKIIKKEDRTLDYLKKTVEKIYQVFLKTGVFIQREYPTLDFILPDEITFITAQELENLYPTLDSKEREYQIVKEKRAVFIIGVGSKLKSGMAHDLRSPDYDDWSLNGDLLVYHEMLDCALELSSMGIRVDKESLLHQLEVSDQMERVEQEFHTMILNEKLPFTIGGGIGQSRLCMFFLQKAHIGEVQASLWSDDVEEICRNHNIELL